MPTGRPPAAPALPSRALVTPYKEASAYRCRLYNPRPPWAAERECERAIPALAYQARSSSSRRAENPKSQEALSYQATASDHAGTRVISPLAV